MTRPLLDPGLTIAFIQSYQATNGCPPTIAEIAAGLGLSRDGAWYRVEVLCKVGLLKKRRYGPRSIEVNDETEIIQDTRNPNNLI